MSKELIVSVTPQETKAAILENDQVIEIYVERDKEQHGLVGSIFRGKVTKVLPGMQSAFVDVGLERDSFLYVSDFFEDTEEYDKIVSTAEEQVARMEAGIKEVTLSPVDNGSHGSDAGLPASSVLKYQDRRGRSRRSRRGRLRGKRFEEVTQNRPQSGEVGLEGSRIPEPPKTQTGAELLPPILPGESLAKYQQLHTVSSAAEPLEEGSRAKIAPMTGPIPGPQNEDEEENDDLEMGEELTEDQDAEEAAHLETETPSARFLQEDLSPLPRSEDPQIPVAELAPQESVLGVRLQDAAEFPPSEGASPENVATLDKGENAETTESSAGVPGEDRSALESQVVTAVESVPDPVVSLLKNTAPEQQGPPPVPVDGQVSVQAQAPASSQTTRGVTQPPVVGASSQVQYRNIPGTPRFFRKNLDRRRRPHPGAEDRKEGGITSEYPLIGDLLKEGQEILVQISKEPLGTKGARITSHIALPGRYLVYMPTVNHIGVSRKIESEEERQRLKRIILENRVGLSGGFIVRTAGEGKGEEEFKSDIRFLSTLWAEIKSKSERRAAPAMIHRDLNLVQRLLRDQLSADFTAIRIDNETEYASILEFVNRFQPFMVNRVKLYTKDTPIFEEFGVQDEIERALRAKVWLKSGGYIVIDQTEALVAIDVNTGKYVGKSNKLEDTIVKTNIEAAKEIARQIRLRDLGGIIVCDFIDMEDRKNRQKVTQTLEEALRADKSPSKVLQFNDFGLVAITRKRVKQSLLKIYCEPCSYCNGVGMVKSPQTVCYEIQAEAKKMAKALEENKEITLRVNPEVAKALKTDEASVITEIETLLKKEVLIKSDPLLHQEHFDIF